MNVSRNEHSVITNSFYAVLNPNEVSSILESCTSSLIANEMNYLKNNQTGFVLNTPSTISFRIESNVKKVSFLTLLTKKNEIQDIPYTFKKDFSNVWLLSSFSISYPYSVSTKSLYPTESNHQKSDYNREKITIIEGESKSMISLGGLHRSLNIDTTISIIRNVHYVDNNVSDQCHIGYLLHLPREAYIDLDEVKNNYLFGDALPTSFENYIDIERPSSVSRQYTVFFSRNLSIPNTDFSKINMHESFPVHLRYQNPRNDGNFYSSVNFLYPKIYIDCGDFTSEINPLQLRFIEREDLLLGRGP